MKILTNDLTNGAINYLLIERHPEWGSNWISGTLILETEKEMHMGYSAWCDIILQRHDKFRTMFEHEVVFDMSSSFEARRLAFKEVDYDFKTRKGVWEKIEAECCYTYWDHKNLGDTLQV